LIQIDGVKNAKSRKQTGGKNPNDNLIECGQVEHMFLLNTSNNEYQQITEQ
jgi:hypothetical protein